MNLRDLVEQGVEAAKHGDLPGVESALDALHDFVSKARCKLEVTDEGLEVRDAFGGVGFVTEDGVFGVAMRDDGIEVLRDGAHAWASGEQRGPLTRALQFAELVTRPQAEFAQRAVSPEGQVKVEAAVAEAWTKAWATVTGLMKREQLPAAHSGVWGYDHFGDCPLCGEGSQEVQVCKCPERNAAEVNRLRGQLAIAEHMVTELQKDNTRLVEERRAAVARLEHRVACYEECFSCEVEGCQKNPREWIDAGERGHVVFCPAHAAAKRPIRAQVEEFQRAMGMPSASTGLTRASSAPTSSSGCSG